MNTMDHENQVLSNTDQQIQQIRQKLQSSQKFFLAVGDEIRMAILCTLLGGECSRQRAIEVTRRTSLSRAAVSHHLQILKSADIVNDRKE